MTAVIALSSGSQVPKLEVAIVRQKLRRSPGDVIVSRVVPMSQDELSQSSGCLHEAGSTDQEIWNGLLVWHGTELIEAVFSFEQGSILVVGVVELNNISALGV